MLPALIHRRFEIQYLPCLKLERLSILFCEKKNLILCLYLETEVDNKKKKIES